MLLLKMQQRVGIDLRILRLLIRLIDQLNDAVGRVVSWFTVVMVINVFLVVTLRYVFSTGWIWMQEFYVWTHATVFLLGAGYTLLHEGHVRIDLIYRDASQKYKAMVNMIGSLFLGLPLIYLVFDRALPMVSRSWLILEKSAEAGGMPGLFLFKSVIVLFAVLFGLQLFALLLRSLDTLLSPGGDKDLRYPEQGG